MRMFLVCITDIFLLLYLTAIANVQPATVLTIGDFYKLKAMHHELSLEKERTEEELMEKLRREEQAKETLSARLNQEKGRLDDMQQNLLDSVSERERINQDLRLKEDMIKARENLLQDLNQQIVKKEADWEKVKDTYIQELESQKAAVEATRQRAEALEVEAKNAQLLADQMQVEAEQAVEAADMAQEVKRRALRLQVKALEEKIEADRRAAEALAAKQQAEEETQKALEAKEAAEAEKVRAERKARLLAATIDEIKQDGETVFEEHIRPQLQNVRVFWKREYGNNDTVFDRELTLLPVRTGGKVYALFPSIQVGFTSRSNKIPRGFIMRYNKQKITSAWLKKEDDLLAIPLPGYAGHADEPHPSDSKITDLMPTLLSVRNNGNVGFSDKVLGVSDEYFIVNRDFIAPDEGPSLKFSMTGFRGTGQRAERIVLGDQLVDLNGKLIGVANTANHIVRFDDLKGWEEIKF